MPGVLTCTSAAHRPQDSGCLDRLNAFASGHRLREMKFSGRNISRVLRAVDPDGPLVAMEGRAVDMRSRTSSGWELAGELYSGPFDHGEVWGRARTPLVIVGHPYHLGRDRSAILRRLESLGLDLVVSRAAGWYGFGTMHVRLAVPGTLPPPADAERFETEMALSD